MFLLARKLQAQLGWCWLSLFVQVSHHNFYLHGVIKMEGEIGMDGMVAGCMKGVPGNRWRVSRKDQQRCERNKKWMGG